MDKVSILPNDLKSFEYYKRKLPLYLQNSEGFVEHFRIWYDMLVGKNEEDSFDGIIPVADTILYLFDIFSDDYLDEILKLDDSGFGDETFGTNQTVLDNIGQLLGVKRIFTVEYMQRGEKVIKQLTLNNEEYLLLIRATIIRNYFDGTYGELTEYYKKADLQIVNLSNPTTSGEANVYLINDTYYNYSDNVKAMFYAGLLTVKSLGISYTYNIVDFVLMALWDTYQVWDTGEWL